MWPCLCRGRARSVGCRAAAIGPGSLHTQPPNLNSLRFLFLLCEHGLGRLKTVSPDKPLVVGSYAYLDGELHVRLSLAMDAIVKGLTESRAHVMVSAENCRRSFYP